MLGSIFQLDLNAGFLMVVADSKMPKKRSSDMVEQSQLTATPKVPKRSTEEVAVEEADDEETDSNDQGDSMDDDDDASDQPSKKQRLDKSELYKPPTSEELNRLRETENLYQSSLFRLQMTELLAEVMIKQKKKRIIDTFITELRTFLMSMEPGETHQLSDTSWLSKCEVLPLKMAPPSDKSQLQFLPPTAVKEMGSYPLGICLKPKPAIDICIEMPKACFQRKDNLNQRYFRKRAFYLTMLAQKLRSSDLVEEMSFTYHLGNRMRPILVLRPKASHGQGFLVHLHPQPEEGAFPLSRFHIDKNNVRRKWYKQEEEDGTAEGTEEIGEAGTPQYNMWILQDLARDNNQAYAEHMLSNHQGIRDGLALLKVWLHQRQLDQGAGCFHSYVMTMYVVYQLAKRKLNPMMSGYQVLRNTLLFLSQSDWTTEGICLAASSQAGPDQPLLVDFHREFDVVFVDRTGYLNLCADVLNVTWQRVQHEAALSIQQMDQPGTDCFQLLFMTPLNFLHKFDQCFHIKPSDLYQACADNLVPETTVIDRCGDVISLCVPKLVALLYKALGGRIELVGYQLNPTPKWPVKSSPPVANEVTLTFGLLINPDEANNVLQKGPSADTPEATEFREFWGERSELRRFQDASICEAVLWPAKSVSGKRTIISQIVKHILNRHAKLASDVIKFVPGPLDSLLRLGYTQSKASPVYGTGEEQTIHIHRCFEDLSKKLRTLQDLPLTIQSIQGLSAVFRYSEVFPPIPVTKKYPDEKKSGDPDFVHPDPSKPCPPWVDTIQVLCMLEGSGKWPDDKDAVQRVKAAFLIKIQQLLIEQHKLVCQLTAKYLDVFMHGFVFRIEIGCKKEVALHKMVKTPEGMLKMVNTETALALEHRIVTLPIQTSTLHGLQQQCSTYSATVRLAKRWLSSQLLLDGYMTEEAVELITASLYISPEPYTKPSSPLVGFLRFLSLLCTHDWQKTPLIVNLNNKLTSEDCTEIQTRFTRDRAALPLMFIATSLDRYQSRCTRSAPTPQILHRVILLANKSLDVINKQLADISTDVDYKHIFRPPMNSYDVIINLQQNELPRQHHAVDITKKTLLPAYREYDTKSQDKRLPVTLFDPVVLYLQELRDTYGELALFFHDRYGGSSIGVVWKPDAFKPVSFKASHVNCRQVTTSSTDKETIVQPNVEAIIEGFKVIGRGLIAKVDSKMKKWTI